MFENYLVAYKTYTNTHYVVICHLLKSYSSCKTSNRTKMLSISGQEKELDTNVISCYRSMHPSVYHQFLRCLFFAFPIEELSLLRVIPNPLNLDSNKSKICLSPIYI